MSEPIHIRSSFMNSSPEITFDGTTLYIGAGGRYPLSLLFRADPPKLEWTGKFTPGAARFGRLRFWYYKNTEEKKAQNISYREITYGPLLHQQYKELADAINAAVAARKQQRKQQGGSHAPA